MKIDVRIIRKHGAESSAVSHVANFHSAESEPMLFCSNISLVSLRMKDSHICRCWQNSTDHEHDRELGCRVVCVRNQKKIEHDRRSTPASVWCVMHMREVYLGPCHLVRYTHPLLTPLYSITTLFSFCNESRRLGNACSTPSWTRYRWRMRNFGHHRQSSDPPPFVAVATGQIWPGALTVQHVHWRCKWYQRLLDGTFSLSSTCTVPGIMFRPWGKEQVYFWHLQCDLTDKIKENTTVPRRVRTDGQEAAPGGHSRTVIGRSSISLRYALHARDILDRQDGKSAILPRPTYPQYVILRMFYPEATVYLLGKLLLSRRRGLPALPSTCFILFRRLWMRFKSKNSTFRFRLQLEMKTVFDCLSHFAHIAPAHL